MAFVKPAMPVLTPQRSANLKTPVGALSKRVRRRDNVVDRASPRGHIGVAGIRRKEENGRNVARVAHDWAHVVPRLRRPCSERKTPPFHANNLRIGFGTP